MNEHPVADDEILWRRIPRVEPYFRLPDEIGAMNFKLRRDEAGISVYRAALTTAERVLESGGDFAEYFLVEATAGEIRTLCNSTGEHAGLDVVPDDPDAANAGHAMIIGPVAGKLTKSTSKALRDLFRLVRT